MKHINGVTQPVRAVLIDPNALVNFLICWLTSSDSFDACLFNLKEDIGQGGGR